MSAFISMRCALMNKKLRRTLMPKWWLKQPGKSPVVSATDIYSHPIFQVKGEYGRYSSPAKENVTVMALTCIFLVLKMVLMVCQIAI
ncbi:hypothetical protein ACQK5W_16495 [Pantoea sp. FN060301]|uniref:hypothetical protein n=1 Tax=Pantoea sp. FN060301 TaxID=3420380 RepID=UPI003D17F6E5